MIAVALDLLRWVSRPLPLERVSGLLLSPYFAGGRQELRARAEFDAFGLRRTKTLLRPEVSLEAMTQLVERTKIAGMNELLAALRRMRQVAMRRFGKEDAQTHAEWADAMREILNAANWGAGESQDSVEFQMQAKWESTLDELATLDFDGVWIRFGAALESVGADCEEDDVCTGVARGSGAGDGSAGGRRQRVRCCVVSAGRRSDLADVGSTNPLLPWQMQRELGCREQMPRER